MFGFKSKRYKKLERINAMLEMELQRLNAMRISAYEKTLHATEKNVITLNSAITVDTYYGAEEAITYAKKTLVNNLVDCIGEYVTIEVRKLDRNDSLDSTKYEVIGRVKVVEK